MNSSAWHNLGLVPPEQLGTATRELHWATQIVAAAGQTFVAPCVDDSHRSMSWDTVLAGFVSEEFSDGYPFRLGLEVEALTLHLLDRTHATLGALALPGTALDDAYAWLRTGLSQYMGGTGPEILRPDFTIPDHPVGEGARFSEGHASERSTLAALYGSASELLDQVAHARADASPVRCWPHHFDIATLLTVRPPRGGDPARTVGVGLSPGGEGFEGWYWYATPWPYPEPEELPPLSPPATWHTDGWTGAVLEGRSVVDLQGDARRAQVAGFIDEAVTAAESALGSPRE